MSRVTESLSVSPQGGTTISETRHFNDLSHFPFTLSPVCERQASHAPAPGERLAPFQVQDQSDAPYTWKPGKASLITFCAFWCDTWKEHLRRVAETKSELAGLPIDFLAISVDGRWTELSKNAPYIVSLTTLKDAGGAWSHGIGIDSIPFTMVVDGSGVIRWAGHGVARSDEMASRLREAMTTGTKGGVIYLTFDDFPKPHDEELLDVLRAQGVPATFFCVCSRAAANADLLKRAVREGNELEVHAWNHGDPHVPFAKCANELRGVTGVVPSLERLPGKEAVTDPQGKALDNYTVDPYDFQRPGVRELLRRVLDTLRPSCIIHLHSGVSQTVQALPEIIEGARRQGYNFATMRSTQGPNSLIHGSKRLHLPTELAYTGCRTCQRLGV